MKTIYLTAISVIAFIFAVAFYSNTYSSINDNNCKCCDSKCTEANCCTEKSGTAQGEMTNCCTDKCTSVECKERCASGGCKMSDNMEMKSDVNQSNTDNTAKSCCMDKTGSNMKNCVK